MRAALRYVGLFFGVLIGTQWLGLVAKQFDADIDVVMAASSPPPNLQNYNNGTDFASQPQTRTNLQAVNQRAPSQADDTTFGFQTWYVQTAVSIVAGGSGYTNGTLNAPVPGGVCQVQPVVQLGVSGGALSTVANATVTLGLCTTPPPIPATITVGGGTGGTVNLTMVPIIPPLWQSVQELFSAQEMNPGAGDWSPRSYPRPLDGLGPMPAGGAAYGSILLLSTYTGPAINVQRADTLATKDIGFIAGTLDTTTLDGFCAGTTCGVAIVYDQSGNGLHATQAMAVYTAYIVGTTMTVTACSACNLTPNQAFTGPGTTVGPGIVSQLTGSTTGGIGTYQITPSQTVGSSGSPVAMNTISQPIVTSLSRIAGPTSPRSIVFWANLGGVGASGSVFLNLPAGVTFTDGNATICSMDRYHDRSFSTDPLFFNSSGAALFSAAIARGNFEWGSGGGIVGTITSPPSMSPAPQCLRTGTGLGNSVVMNYGNAAHLATKFFANVQAGGKWGGLYAGQVTGNFESDALIIYPAAVSAKAEAALQASLVQYSGTTPQATDVLFCDGDSIQEGFAAFAKLSMCRQLQDMLSEPMLVYDGGIGGSTITNQTSLFSTNVVPTIAPAARNVVIWQEGGVNDLVNNTTLAQMQTAAEGYMAVVSTEQATIGKPIKLLFSTVLPSTALATSKEALRQTYNAWEKDPSPAGLVQICLNTYQLQCSIVDEAASVMMGNVLAPFNTDLYVDGTHPTSYGHGILAPIAAAAINRVLH